MEPSLKRRETKTGTWDEEHIKALLHFPRFPMRLIQQEPWQGWIGQRGGLREVYAYLRAYPLAPSHRRILDVVLSNPEAVAGVYADRLNISRATYFYQLRELVPALVQALNQWDLTPLAAAPQPVPHQAPDLPAPLTPLIGLEPALRTLGRLLQRDDVRLLTLLGPGGIGKTRLAIELVGRVKAEVGFVDLSQVREATQVPAAIAEALGLEDRRDSAVKSYLKPRDFFLVLDNFEQVLAARDVVTALLAAAPRLRILITSRAALRVYGEHEFVVPPLAMPAIETPDDPQLWMQSPAVALFVQRAQAVNPAFLLSGENMAAVAELCLRMEGLPLAIELAAYQVKYFSPQAMLVRLSNTHRLNFLSHVPPRLPPHQQSMRGMLDWSFDLLSADLQTLFCRLAVFSGGCTIEAAEGVCAQTDAQGGLTALADQSLLEQQAEPDGEPHFRMAEMTREYALERLDSRGETESLRRLHALYYLELAENLKAFRRVRSADRAQVLASKSMPPTTNPGVSIAAASPEETFIILQREYVNLSSALQWTLDQREGELGLRFIVALWDYWKSAGWLWEGRQFTQAVIEQTATLRLPIRARVLRLAGWLAHDVRDGTTMQSAFQASHELSESLGDQCETGLALHGLGELAQLRGQFERAREYIGQALGVFQGMGNQKHLAWSQDLLGRIELGQGNLPAAQLCFQESLELFDRLQSNSGLTVAGVHLAQSLFYQGHPGQAAPLLEECLSRNRAMGKTRGSAFALALNMLAEIAAARSQPGLAHDLNDQALCLGRAAGYGWCTEQANFTAGLLAWEAGDLERAAACFQESLTLQQSFPEGWRALALLEATAELAVERRDGLGAARLFGAAEALRASRNIARMPIYADRYATGLRQLQERIEPAALAEAWHAGRALSLEQALLYALRCLE